MHCLNDGDKCICAINLPVQQPLPFLPGPARDRSARARFTRTLVFFFCNVFLPSSLLVVFSLFDGR